MDSLNNIDLSKIKTNSENSKLLQKSAKAFVKKEEAFLEALKAVPSNEPLENDKL